MKEVNPKIKVTKKDFIKYLIKALKINITLKELTQTNDFIEICYETDIMPNTIENFYKVFDFLNLTYPDYEFPLKKIAPKPKEFLINYNDLRKLEKEIKKDFNTGNIEKWEELIKPKKMSYLRKLRKYSIYYIIKFLKKIE